MEAESKGMKLQRELQARVRDVLIEQEHYYGDDETQARYGWHDAAGVLAGLGLDDLDAAVERGARRLVWEQHQGCVEWEDTNDTTTTGDPQTRAYALANVRAVLEAAFTCSATEGPQDD